MKFIALVVALLMFCSVSAHAVSMTHSVPPESFLDYHVDTVPQLTFEVTYDAAVRMRLARHFHLSNRAMCAYISHDLVLRHLTEPLRTRVYCLPRTGHEFYVMMTLPKGTPVFAQRGTGRPVLRLVCGNPLVAALPPTPKVIAPPKLAKAPSKEVRTRIAASHSPQSLKPNCLTVAQITITSSKPLTFVADTASVPGEVVFIADGNGSSLSSFLNWAGAMGGVAALLSHGGGGGSAASGHQNFGIVSAQKTPQIPLSEPMPAPEPNSALVMGIGGLMLAGFGCVRSQRKRRLS